MVYTDHRQFPVEKGSGRAPDEAAAPRELRGKGMKNKNKNARWQGRALSVSERKTRDLVKIGELAAEYDILPSTINFYTREGILPEAARSRGGYRLYEREQALAILKRIDYLQNVKRLSIAEIKKTLQ